MRESITDLWGVGNSSELMVGSKGGWKYGGGRSCFRYLKSMCVGQTNEIEKDHLKYYTKYSELLFL